ncbi:MAG: 2-C-methyl-D-erythritol 2,4-cyclodiphosphate synthase [Alicyclobacillaceae bacterium]|nr:2-C-methyl-D-erythritol 2,4-cyclodiphosphate synthase [Alicyclobacillaceae bacterium]
MRIGIGIDVHPFRDVPGDVRLAGVPIPHDKTLVGHSDADVVLHAVMDALLGAIGEGDIGTHFPDTDPAYRGADSAVLCRRVWEMVKGRGYRLGNLDVAILAERPRIGPHVPEMRRTLAELLEAGPDCINIKATTTEKLGFIGREEGLAAQAVVLLLPR